ncbi:hypothetical protein [Leucobacter sp. PH1c]|uniref:hypothetical protein n=1 Tax=Leucobacter sp. PH1c TaxID=1397278 RepID=UPI00046AD543|nr:hypothetical protein [Leucobacter sp. PH1c]
MTQTPVSPDSVPRADTAASERSDRELDRRLRALEAENAALRAGQSGRRPRGILRSLLAAVALTLAVLLAPLAVLASWVRIELVDTDRFVATLAPLAEDPAVQSFLGDQVMAAVDEQVDFDAIVGSLASGLTSLELPSEADAAITLLRGPAAQGMRSVVASTVEETIASDAFAGTWQLALTNTHRATIALMRGDTNGMLTLDRDTGELAIDAGVIVAQVKDQLEARGFGLASMIPNVTASIPLTTAEGLVGAQLGYAAAVALGTWLPWLVLALLVAGVALARRRTRALARTGFGLTLGFLLLLGGLSVGAALFEQAVSPGVMPGSTAAALTTQLTESLRSTSAALAFAAALIALAALLLGPSRGAVALRSALTSGFARARAAYSAHGVTTGAVGTAIERFRSALALIVAVGGVLIIFLARPVNAPTIAWTTVGVLGALALIELLRRPEAEEHRAEAEEHRAEAEEHRPAAESA